MTEPGSLDIPADTIWERAGESKRKIWFLVLLNRWTVTGVILVGTLLLLVLLEIVGPSSIEGIVSGNAVGTVFGSVIIAIVTSVTLVLTVAQLVLSEQIGEMDEHRERMAGEVDFRNRIEEVSGVTVSPAEPAGVFRTLLTVTETHADGIAAHVRESGSESEFATVLAYADAVIEESRKTQGDLKGAEFGTFEVLLPVLNYNYSWKIHAAQSLRAEYDDELPPEAVEAFTELITVLQLFAPTREYFKSQYFQWEIINISRATLYGAMPALAIAGYMILAFDPGGVTGSLFGASTSYLFVSAIFVFSLLPFAVLLAYILRILTIQKRTLAIGPFILRETKTVDRTSNRD